MHPIGNKYGQKAAAGAESLSQTACFKAHASIPELDFNRVFLKFLPDERAKRADQHKNEGGGDQND